MRPADVPQTAILAARAAVGELDKRRDVKLLPRIDDHHVAAIIAAAVTGTNAEKSAEDRDAWLATSIAQREHAETATRAILHQTELIQQIVDKVLGIGNAPTEYEVWRDALTLAVSERSHIDADGVSSSGLLARARWFHNKLNLGPRAPEADDAEGEE